MIDAVTLGMTGGMVLGAVAGYVLTTFRIIRFRDRRYIIRRDQAIEETARSLKLAETREAKLTCERDNWKRLAEMRSEQFHGAIEGGKDAVLDHTEELR
jgi:hypothetical protein